VQVDPEGLRDIASDMIELLDVLGTVQVQHIDCDRRFVGHAGLADAYEEFTEAWRSGVMNMAADGEGMADALKAAADAYEEHDRSVADMIESLGARLLGEVD
jgi:uncharacterized protein YukE